MIQVDQTVKMTVLLSSREVDMDMWALETRRS